jgi:hypothetical protein
MQRSHSRRSLRGDVQHWTHEHRFEAHERRRAKTAFATCFMMNARTLSGHVPISFRNWAPKTNAKRIVAAPESFCSFQAPSECATCER